MRAVTRLHDFDALASIWEEVTRERSQTSPFLSHDWFACCWRTAGPDRRREVWMLEDTAGPVALIPLTYSTGRAHGLPVRTVQIMGAPNAPYIDDLPAACRTEEAITALVESLRPRRDWDVFTLTRLPADSGILKAFNAVVPGQFCWRVVDIIQSPYVSIVGTWEDFLRSRSSQLKTIYDELDCRLQRAGRVDVEEHREIDPDGAILSEVAELCRDSWKSANVVEITPTNGLPRFFHELTQRASVKGWLRVWVLRIDGRAVASEYQIAANGALHVLRADSDASLGALAPDANLNARIVRSLFDRGQTQEYHLGPNADGLRRRWATTSRELLSIDVYAPTVYGRLLHGIETRLLPLARRWRRKQRTNKCV